MKIILFYGMMALVQCSAVGQYLVVLADAGVIRAPFILTNGYIYQVQDSVLTSGGRAVYSFTVTDPGEYAIQVLVNAPNGLTNSLYVNIDSEPQDPAMICDIPVTSGFEQRLVSWRGTGSPDKAEFAPQYFVLTAGKHQLIIRGRGANIQIKSFSFVQRPSAPTGLHIVEAP